MSTDQTFSAESNPADFNGDAVAAYLADADQAEVDRVLAAETGDGGKDRVGVKNAAEARTAALQAEADQPGDDQEKTGLETTGNPNDLATPSKGNDSADIAHQEGTPEELAKAADKAVEDGFLGTNAQKPDYSQANPAVMNQEG